MSWGNGPTTTLMGFQSLLSVHEGNNNQAVHLLNSVHDGAHHQAVHLLLLAIRDRTYSAWLDTTMPPTPDCTPTLCTG